MSRRILFAAALVAMPLAMPAHALEGSLETPKPLTTLGGANDKGDASQDTGILTGEETVTNPAPADASTADRFKARASTRMDKWLEAMVQYDGTGLNDDQIARLNDVWATAQRDFAALMSADDDAFPEARETFVTSMEALNETWSDVTQTAAVK